MLRVIYAMSAKDLMNKKLTYTLWSCYKLPLGIGHFCNRTWDVGTGINIHPSSGSSGLKGLV